MGKGVVRRSAWIAAPVLALATLFAPATAPGASAATDSLALTTNATYTVVPSKAVVRVVVDVDARNDKPDLVSGGVRTRYFYDGFRLGLQPEATSIRATTGRSALRLTATPGTDYTTVDVRFGTSIFQGQTAKVRLSYDLPTGLPRSKSLVRVGPAFATFVAWAFGDGGTVRIVVPSAFEAKTSGSTLTRTSSGAATIYTATGISDVPDWYAVINADRATALTSERIDLAGGEHVVVHAWPDDPAWLKDVTTLLTTGMPKLVDQTGLHWPVTQDLAIFEVHTSLLDGYSGAFFEGENRIEISEDLDDLTILHEASHAWFNSGLFEGRWINEGFADTYASQALDALGLGTFKPRPVSPTEAEAVKLNEWMFPGRISDQATNAREAFGYNGSWTVVRSLLADIGGDGMRAVLAAAEHHDIAYQGAGSPEQVSGATDWRRLLDLLDERGQSRTADALFSEWVAGPDDASAMAARAKARAAYAGLVAQAHDWSVPLSVRKAMSDWQFGAVGATISAGETVLQQRDAIAGIADQLGATPPTDLRAEFELATDSFDRALRTGRLEVSAVQSLKSAADAVAAPRAPLVSLGLLGTDPQGRLRALLAAFSAGAPTTKADAQALFDTIGGAAAVGRDRLLIGLAVAVAIVVVLIAAGLLARRRRHGRGPLPAQASAGQITSDASATLADQSGGTDTGQSAPTSDTGDAP